MFTEYPIQHICNYKISRARVRTQTSIHKYTDTHIKHKYAETTVIVYRKLIRTHTQICHIKTSPKQFMLPLATAAEWLGRQARCQDREFESATGSKKSPF